MRAGVRQARSYLAAGRSASRRVNKIFQIEKLIARGYELTVVSGSHYRKLFEDDGATFVSLEGSSDFTDFEVNTNWPVRATLPTGLPQLIFDKEHIFVKNIPSQHEAQQRTLKMLAEKHPGRPIVSVVESIFWGAIPLLAGAPGIMPTATLGIGVVPTRLSSIDCAPPGSALPPDSTPEGRLRNQAMTKDIQGLFGAVQKACEDILDKLGATLEKKPYFLDATYILPDRFPQMCIPSAKYPRSDVPSSFGFAGGLPKGRRDPYAEQPAWWKEVTENKMNKIVTVSQGTLAINYTELIIPTMTALADRDDILVVVALGKKGASLSPDIKVPTNARVADFIPFDDLLPHSTAFISNGGYGAFQHAISNGTPLIIGGGTEDKPEVAARAEWAGFGIDLKTGTSTAEQLRVAVEEILGNGKYKKRALELELEMATHDPMGVVARTVDKLAMLAH